MQSDTLPQVDIMIIGAAKAGTTSLANYLGGHPQIITHQQIEMSYFYDEVEFDKGYKVAFSRYFKGQLKEADSNTLVLAKNASLLNVKEGIERLYDHNPDCQIIITMRNPVDRTFSTYLWGLNRGERAAHQTSFEDTIIEAIEGYKNNSDDWKSWVYIDQSIYHKHIEMVWSIFPKEQTTLIVLEDFTKNPLEQLNSIFSKLGLDLWDAPDLDKKYNPAKKVRSRTYAKMVHSLLNERGMFKKAMRKLIPSAYSYRMGEWLRNINLTRADNHTLDSEVRAYLASFYEPHNKKLEKIIGREISAWNEVEQVQPETTEPPVKERNTGFIGQTFTILFRKQSTLRKLMYAQSLRRNNIRNPNPSLIEDNIIITGSPRSGTTWIAGILSEIPNTALLWEPLYLLALKKVSKLNFGWQQHIPEDADWPEAKDFMNRLFLGQVIAPSYVSETTKEALERADRFVIKFCRLNMMMPWILNNFNIRIPIYIVRHPCSVIASQLKFGFGKNAPDRYVIPEQPYNEIFYEYEHILKSVRSNEELLAANWALENLIPLKSQDNNSKWITLSYEKLLLNPHEEVAKVFSRIGEAVPSSVYSKIQQPSARTQKNRSEVKPEILVSNWTKKLTPKQIERILNIVHAFGINAFTDNVEPDYSQILSNSDISASL